MTLSLTPSQSARVQSWSAVRAGADPSVAEPPALECAAALAADPGGELAPLWTFGLVAMAGYLAWRPGADLERAALDALSAADRALRDRPCDHTEHPYERTLAALEDDAVWEHGPDLSDPDRLRADEEWWCPVNVAGFARVTADVIAPFRVGDLPETVPESDASTINDLDGILNDYPYADPAWTLESVAGSLPSHPTEGVRAGYVVTVWACVWYAVSGRIRSSSVLDAMIEGLEEVLPQLAGDCDHEADAHPSTDHGADGVASDGIHLRSPGGRAELDWDDEAAVPARNWLCPVFLRGLAEDALSELQEGRERLFGTRDTAPLDERYLLPGGRMDIKALTALVEDSRWATGTYAESVPLWAARRHARPAADAGALERTTTLLLAIWGAEVLGLPYAVVRDLRPVLREAETAGRQAGCVHGDAHPTERRDLREHLNHLYAPEQFPAPEHAFPTEAWLCPGYLAAAAGHAADGLDELYEAEDAYAAGA